MVKSLLLLPFKIALFKDCMIKTPSKSVMVSNIALLDQKLDLFIMFFFIKLSSLSNDY